MKIENRSVQVEPFEGNVLVTLGEAPMQPRTAVVLSSSDALKLAEKLKDLLVPQPDASGQCNGSLVHSEFILCPVHDR